MKGEQQIILDWITKAQHDLTSARIILASEEGPTDVVCFHSQQAAEKTQGSSRGSFHSFQQDARY